MPLPLFKRVLFGKDQLRLVLGQVRFPLLFRFGERQFLAPFQEAIERDFPRVSSEQALSLKFSGKGLEQAGETLWRFSDREGWSCVLGEGALTLECRRFTSIDDFEARFVRLLEAAQKHLGVEERTRLGLRFINEFRVQEAATLKEWAQYLNPKFIGFAGAPEFLDGSVEHAFQELRQKKNDGLLVIRHGLLTGTTVELRPNDRPNDRPLERGPFYLLDLDYFVETEGTLDIAATMKQLSVFNDEIYRFFRWTIDGGKLYDLLEPR